MNTSARLHARIAGFGRWLMFAQALVQSSSELRSWVRPALSEVRRQTRDALPLALLLSTLGGALIAQQTGFQFQGNLPNWVIGSIVSSSLISEVTPMFVGIAMIGMVGTRIAAELGAMEVTEQIDALEVIGRDPILYLVLPRVVAATIVAPLIMSFALLASMVAGWWAAVLVTNATTQDFWFGVRHYMRDFPMFFALIKGICFGLTTTFVACYIGLTAQKGSIGVGHAVKSAVVGMLVTMVVVDCVTAPLLKIIRI